MAEELIFHMCRREEWQAALAQGAYHGSSQDRADGFIHFSSAGQIEASAARHRAGQPGLVLLAVDPLAVAPHLKWEMSSSGERYPHLHAALPVDAVRWVRDLPLGPNGRHRFPELA